MLSQLYVEGYIWALLNDFVFGFASYVSSNK